MNPIDSFRLFMLILAKGMITGMCSASLRQGYIPTSQHHATLTPRLKKPNADVADAKNYRKTSNLTFIFKIIERFVCCEVVACLKQHHLSPGAQSAYRRRHSMETAVLKMISDASCRSMSFQGHNEKKFFKKQVMIYKQIIFIKRDYLHKYYGCNHLN